MPRKTRPSQISKSPEKLKQQTLLSHFSSSPCVSPVKKGSKSKPTTGKRITTRDSEADDDDEHKRKHIRRSSSASEKNSDSSDVGKIHFELDQSSQQTIPPGESNSEDDRGQPFSPSRPTKRSRILNSGSEGDGDIIATRASRRVIKRDEERRELNFDSDPPKVGGRIAKGKRPGKSDGEEDILSGIDEEKVIDNRMRKVRPSYVLECAFDDTPKEKKRGLTVSESEESEEESEEETQDESDDLLPGARPDRDPVDSADRSSSEHSKSGSEGLDDFIIEDDGEQQVVALPAMFSMSTHQDLVVHFKVVCQYMVHVAVTTPAARSRISERLLSDDYFSVPLSITRRKLGDIRDSIASSVWRPTYKRVLLTYPEFNLHHLDFAIPHCDACNLGSRLSTFVVQLGGDPYDTDTFQSKTVGFGGSSDESDGGRERAAPEFNLGRFCARRTEVFHKLSHWEHDLFRALSREVDGLSDSGRGFVKIGYTGGVEPPDDVSDADQVMEWLDRRGIINAEWLRVKDMIADATGLEADVKRGKQDD